MQRSSLQTILCFPDSSLQNRQDEPETASALFNSRLSELQQLGIQRILSVGSEQIQGQKILGKGYCGLVVLAEQCLKSLDPKPGSIASAHSTTSHECRTVAVKIRRTDAPKNSFAQEAHAMAIANSYHIGPMLFGHSPNFLVMEYLPTVPLFHQLQQSGSTLPVRDIVRHLLEQCFQLDQLGLDHGNLRCATEHVFLRGYQPVIIDFSSSSFERRPANLTTLVQGLFRGTQFKVALAPHVPIPDQPSLICQLRHYKQTPTLDSFQQVLDHINLATLV